MWDSSADHKHNTVLLFFADAIDPLGPGGITTGPLQPMAALLLGGAIITWDVLLFELESVENGSKNLQVMLPGYFQHQKIVFRRL